MLSANLLALGGAGSLEVLLQGHGVRVAMNDERISFLRNRIKKLLHESWQAQFRANNARNNYRREMYMKVAVDTTWEAYQLQEELTNLEG